MKESNPLDHIEPRGHDPGYDGRASRVAGGERFAPAISRAKPLHWTRLLAIAGLVGAVVGAVLTGVLVGVLVDGGDPFGAAMLGLLVGAPIGLVAVSALERMGVFRRVDEL